MSISQAHKDIVNSEKKEAHKQNIEAQKEAIAKGEAVLPAGVFEVIAIDPPWNYGRGYDPEGSRVANPYPEMSQEELKKLEIPSAGDCVMFLWTTQKFLFDAKELLDIWGFESGYRTGINKKHYDEYNFLKQKYGVPFFLYFVDEIEEAIYGNELKTLEKNMIIANYKVPTVLFLLSDMKTVSKLTKEQVETLKRLSNRNHDYKA